MSKLTVEQVEMYRPDVNAGKDDTIGVPAPIMRQFCDMALASVRDAEHLAPEPDPKAHRRCKCEFSGGGFPSKVCAYHKRTALPAPSKAAPLVEQRDGAHFQAFFTKHALGSKVCPSCFVCGVSKPREEWARTHLELPDIYVCVACVTPAVQLRADGVVVPREPTVPMLTALWNRKDVDAPAQLADAYAAMLAAAPASPAAAKECLAAGVSRAEWHDKAWALFHAKTFDDTQLSKVNIHTIRAVFDATYEALLPLSGDRHE